MKLKIRNFQNSDVKEFVEMCRWLGSNSYFKQVSFEPAKMVAVFVQVMTSPDYYGQIIETEDGKIVGAFVGYLQEYFFSTDKIANELGFMVKEGYRKNALNALAKIFTDFEYWAKEKGALETQISPSTGLVGKKFESFLNGLGYKNVGYTAKKWIAS